MKFFIKAGLLLFFFAGTLGFLRGQDEKKLLVRGYVKNMQTLLFFNDAYPDLRTGQLRDTFFQDNLLHNRLNFTWFAGKHLTVKAALRNRVFYGEWVKANPAFSDQVSDANNDYFDLSAVLSDKPGFVVHTMLDRFYLEYLSGKWEIRAGRQRVNWGIGSVWNPNDLFNAFAFTDFDYEERPGADALRVKYYTGFVSSIELVATAADQFRDATVAALWRFHAGNYDFQLLAGRYEREWVLGGGWAGSIKDAGFKGEFTRFKDAFAASWGLDYTFPKGTYLNLGYLYNSNGSRSTDISGLFGFELSARNLYPYRHALFGQLSYPFHPLVNGFMAVIYSPVRIHPLFLNPGMTWSIATNWDLDFIGQIVMNRNETYKSPIQAVFLRFKFSF